MGLIQTALASSFSEPGVPLDHSLPSVRLMTEVPRGAPGARWEGHSRIQDEIEAEVTVTVMQLAGLAPVL